MRPGTSEAVTFISDAWMMIQAHDGGAGLDLDDCLTHGVSDRAGNGSGIHRPRGVVGLRSVRQHVPSETHPVVRATMVESARTVLGKRNPNMRNGVCGMSLESRPLPPTPVCVRHVIVSLDC